MAPKKDSHRAHGSNPLSRTLTSNRFRPESPAASRSNRSTSPSQGPRNDSAEAKKSEYQRYQEQHKADLLKQSRSEDHSLSKRPAIETPAPPPDSTYQKLLDSLQNQREELQKINGLIHTFETNKIAFGALADMAATKKKNLLSLQESLGPVLAAMTTSQRSTRASGVVAKRVFSIMELLELIFDSCRPIDIVRFKQAICVKQVWDTVDDPKWQKHLGLEPDSQLLHLPLADAFDETGIEIIPRVIRARDDRSDLSDSSQEGEALDYDKKRIWIDFSYADNIFDSNLGLVTKLRGLGMTEQKMLISQPPLTKLECEVTCFCMTKTRDRKTTGSRTIASKSGLTIGELIKTFAQLQQEHTLCPDAMEIEHDKKGYTRPDIRAQGLIDVPPGDLKFKSLVDMQVHGLTPEIKFYRRIHRYKKAKQRAKLKGMVIPTLAEFEAHPCDFDEEPAGSPGLPPWME